MRSHRDGWSESEELQAITAQVALSTTSAVLATGHVKASKWPTLDLKPPAQRVRPRHAPLTRTAIREALLRR